MTKEFHSGVPLKVLDGLPKDVKVFVLWALNRMSYDAFAEAELYEGGEAEVKRLMECSRYFGCLVRDYLDRLESKNNE